MKWWRNLRIRTKLMGGLFIVILLFLGGFSFGFFQMFTIEQETANMEKTNEQAVVVADLSSSIRAEYIVMSDLVRVGILYGDQYEAYRIESTDQIEALQGSFSTEEQQELFDRIIQQYERFVMSTEDMVAEGTGSQADMATLASLRDGMVENLNTLNELVMAEVVASTDGVQNSIETARFIFIISIATAIVLGGIIFFTLSQGITRTLNKVVANAEEISNGNLHVEQLNDRGKDELGRLGFAINKMVVTLRGLITEVADTSSQVASSSEQLSASTTETSRAAEQITESIQEVASTAEKQLENANSTKQSVTIITAQVDGIRKSIANVDEATKDSAEKAKSGKETINRTIKQMDQISVVSNDTSMAIQKLAEHSTKIGDMAHTITDVANQTNLLALNAAIEAARAGEHGKGFAVVADEVRKLAEQTTNASSSISQLLEEIQQHIEKSAMSVTESFMMIEDGQTYANDAGNAFETLTTSVNQVFEQVAEVTNAIEQINESAVDMVNNADETARVSESTAEYIQNVASSAEEQNATMEEVAASTSQLANLAEKLQENLRQFRA